MKKKGKKVNAYVCPESKSEVPINCCLQFVELVCRVSKRQLAAQVHWINYACRDINTDIFVRICAFLTIHLLLQLLLIVACLDTGQDCLIYMFYYLSATIIMELWMIKESMEYYKGKVIMNIEGQYIFLSFSFPAAKNQHVH